MISCSSARSHQHLEIEIPTVSNTSAHSALSHLLDLTEFCSYLISRASFLIVSFSNIHIKAAMANLGIFLLISLSLCHIRISAGHGENAYNFMCDRTPQQHDRILRDAIMNLERGDTCITYICMLHNVNHQCKVIVYHNNKLLCFIATNVM